MTYKVFFAWQSQKKQTEKYIKKELKRIRKELALENMDLELIFSPTQDLSGSPDIKNSIIEQIKSSDIFIGDLSFIDDRNSISNGNVLYEAGIADAFLGEERVVLICDENTVIEDIVFDINHKRISGINTAEEKSPLKYYIRAALEESDRTRYIKTYATGQYEEEILILLNYFYKYINMSKRTYDGVFTIPSIKEIEATLKESVFPEFILNADFCKIITQLEEKMLRLNQFSHKRIIWNVMNIITRLQDYQKFCTQTRYSFISIINNKTEEYNVYYSKNFFVKSKEEFSFDNRTVLFLENSMLLNGKHGFYPMDKRILKKDDPNYREETLPLDKGYQIVVSSRQAKIAENAINIVSSLVSNILLSIKGYLDYCEKSVSFETEILLTIN